MQAPDRYREKRFIFAKKPTAPIVGLTITALVGRFPAYG
jgi:hypothetical protein